MSHPFPSRFSVILPVLSMLSAQIANPAAVVADEPPAQFADVPKVSSAAGDTGVIPLQIAEGATNADETDYVILGGVPCPIPEDAFHSRPSIDERALAGGCDITPEPNIDLGSSRERDGGSAPRGVQAGVPWPNGDVYYVFGSNTTPDMQAAALQAMDTLSLVADLTFQPAMTQEDGTRIAFWDSDKNSSPIGWVPPVTFNGFLFAPTRIIRVTSWNNQAIIMHEIMHSLGIKHEQSRSDRDTYVEIISENIESGKSHNFSRTSGATYGNYDFNSVMHYSNCAFSECEDPWCTTGRAATDTEPAVPATPGCYTILVKPPYDAFWNGRIGNRSFLSDGDVNTLRAIYGFRWAHDECDDADPIAGEGTFSFDNRYATASGITGTACFQNGNTNIDRDVWLRWTCQADGIYKLNSCQQTGIDTKIAVYNTGSCPTEANLVTCNDDTCGTRSEVFFDAIAGAQYLIQIGMPPVPAPQIGDVVRLGGTGTITIDREIFNNTCTTASVIGGNNLTIPYDNTLATEDGVDNSLCSASGFSGIEHDLWYRWTAPMSGVATLSTCGLSNADTKVAVYLGNVCPEGIAIEACNDDACDTQSSASWEALEGATYLLRIGVYQNATPMPGQFTVGVEPFPDFCPSAELIPGPGIYEFDTRFATNSNSFGGCGVIQSNYESDVWYRYLADETRIVRISTCAFTNLDTIIGVYDSCPELIDGTLGIDRVITCNDDDCDEQSFVEFKAVNGQEYWIRIGTRVNTPTGLGSFRLTELGVIAENNNCSEPIILEGNALQIHGTFRFANHSGYGGGCSGPATDEDVFYEWTSPGIGTLKIATCGTRDYLLSGPATHLSVHSECPPTDANSLACNVADLFNEELYCESYGNILSDSALTLSVTTGQVLKIRVAKDENVSGSDDFFLSLNYVGLPTIADQSTLVSTLGADDIPANLAILNPLDNFTFEFLINPPLTVPGDLPTSAPLFPFDDFLALPVINEGNLQIVRIFGNSTEGGSAITAPNDLIGVATQGALASVYDNPSAIFDNPALLENGALFNDPIFSNTDILQTPNPLFAISSQGFALTSGDNPDSGLQFSLAGVVNNIVSATMPLVPVQGGAQNLGNNYPIVVLDRGGNGFMPGIVAVDIDNLSTLRVDGVGWNFVPNAITTMPGTSDEFLVAGGTGFQRGGAVVGQVVRFNLDGQTEVLSSGGYLVNPTDMAFEADGNLLVADPDAQGGRGAVIRIFMGGDVADDNDLGPEPPAGESPAGDQFIVAVGEDTDGDPIARPVGITVVRCEPVTYEIAPGFDTPDTNPGDGVVNSTFGNPSLRAAIQEANASPCDNGVIIQLGFATYGLALSGQGEDASATGDLDITGYVRIRGVGIDETIIDANSIDRVFEVHPGATLVLSDLTIREGIGDGAGIRNRGNLALHRVKVTNNSGSGGAGAVRNDARMLAIDCEFASNSSTSNGGGISGFGADSTTDLRRCLIRDNTTNLNGGGVAFGNSATALMENVTFSENQARFNGGGVFCNNATVNMNHCTVTLCEADNDSDGVGDGGGLLQAGGTINLSNSIVAFNVKGPGTRSDISGTINSGGYNNIRQVSPGILTGNLAGNITGFGANLLGLADNGGVTRTHALAPGSIGIDDADPNASITFDQRHKFRPYDGDEDGTLRCDMGAYEFRGRKGDVNCDGLVDGRDVQAFVAAAMNENQYDAQYPGCDLSNADMNEDGSVLVDDIAALVPLILAD